MNKITGFDQLNALEYLKFVAADYQFDRNDERYVGFLNTCPRISDYAIARKIAQFPHSFETELKRVGLCIERPGSLDETVYHQRQYLTVLNFTDGTVKTYDFLPWIQPEDFVYDGKHVIDSNCQYMVHKDYPELV